MRKKERRETFLDTTLVCDVRARARTFRLLGEARIPWPPRNARPQKTRETTIVLSDGGPVKSIRESLLTIGGVSPRLRLAPASTPAAAYLLVNSAFLSRVVLDDRFRRVALCCLVPAISPDFFSQNDNDDRQRRRIKKKTENKKRTLARTIVS